MDLSIVTTIYRTESSIREFYQRAVTTAKDLAKDFEIIFVNDGSPDNGLQVALELHQEDPRIVIADLSRNFGQHKAMMTGLQFARGDLVFLLDGDLEEEPEWLLKFSKVMESTNADVVYGVQERRRGGWFERFSGEIFYSVLNHLAGIPFPRNVVTARLMTRRYVKSLLQYREQEIFIAGLWYITGFHQVPVKIHKTKLTPTSYSLSRKVSITVTGITSFSNKPLIYIFYIGSLISFISLLFILIIVLQKIFLGVALVGWPSLIASIWFLGGLLISFIGILGIYLAKIFIETKERPYTTVRALYGYSELDDQTSEQSMFTHDNLAPSSK